MAKADGNARTSSAAAGARRQAKKSQPAHRTYVLDTSVLLADPSALRRFDEHEVVLPIVVVTELEGKRAHPELGYFARAALRVLDELRIRHGRLDAPVPIGDDGGTLRVELNHSDPSVAAGRASGSATTTPASWRLPSTCRRRAPTSRWSPRTCRCGSRPRRSDWPPRSTAPSCAIESGYTGMTEIDVTADDYRRAVRPAASPTSPPPRPALPHTVWCCCPNAGSALGRVTPDKQVRLVRGDREAFGLRGRSAEQRVALDLLLDPEIGIVSLGGRAGTGKSALALCAGLEAVLGAPPAQEGRRLPAALRRRRAGARLPPGQRVRRRCSRGRRRSSTPSGRSPALTSSTRCSPAACSRCCR